ncbi:hypothetical protein [Acrocarpospora corrugata]|uniref:hypothetical protein n=1 Tax=Acrocarpospora corrugata TaxID=35763 RepID=UPI0012D35712|nr:hypothetical protein [Acrocarpospora corrugata]
MAQPEPTADNWSIRRGQLAPEAHPARRSHLVQAHGALLSAPVWERYGLPREIRSEHSLA